MYEDLFSDLISTVKRTYKKFELEYSQEVEDKMKIYLKNNKQEKYGRHKYTLEEYGFAAEAFYQEYEGYMEKYNYGIPDKFR